MSGSFKNWVQNVSDVSKYGAVLVNKQIVPLIMDGRCGHDENWVWSVSDMYVMYVFNHLACFQFPLSGSTGVSSLGDV